MRDWLHRKYVAWAWRHPVAADALSLVPWFVRALMGRK